MKDLRTFFADYSRLFPEEIVSIDRAVDAKWHASAVATKAERELQQARARLKSDKPEERYMGARRLSELGDRGSVADLIAAAEKAPVARLRAVHVQFVGKVKAEEAIPFLVRSLDDADEIVRAAAVSALLNTTGVYIAEPEGWKRWYADRPVRKK